MSKLVRCLGVAAAMALLVTGCTVENESVEVSRATTGLIDGTSGAAASAASSTLQPIGPIPGGSHWHAAYIVRICDDVLAPFDSDADPLGIHSHADGLMHIHPFVAEAGFERATLSHFADAMGFELTTGELVLPGGGEWRDGDLCNGVPGRVFVDRWEGPGAQGAIERIFEDPEQIRFLADGEVYQIGFAPPDSPPVVPPSLSLLPQVMPAPRAPVEPWVDIDGQADLRDASIAVVTDVSAAPCAAGQTLERVRVGEAACFSLGPSIPLFEAVRGAQAVSLNREPAVDISTDPRFAPWLFGAFAQFDQGEGIVLAVVIDDRVVTAPLLSRPPATQDRLVISGGFSDQSASALAALLDS